MTVVIIDDSVLMRNIIAQILADAGIQVVGQASDGATGADLVERLRPDLAIMDFNMPRMNGVEATRAIMARCPTPVVVFSNEVDAALSFNALQAGAAEVMPKPDMEQFNNAQFLSRFIDTLRAAAAMKPRSSPVPAARCVSGSAVAGSVHPAAGRYEAVVIGASTGGPIAVRDLLQALPADFPIGIALVQHIEDRFDAGYAGWLDSACKLHVRLAKEGDVFTPGEVLVAPGNRHLVCRNRRFGLDDGPKVVNQRPAVDRLFATTADCYGDRLIAVLLTGMGTDGADGCVVVKNAGGLTLVQDEATSFIYGMPKAAFDRGGAVHVLPLPAIPTALLSAVGRKHG